MQHKLIVKNNRVFFGERLVFSKEKEGFCFDYEERLLLTDKTSFLKRLCGKTKFSVVDARGHVVGEVRLQGLGALAVDLSLHHVRFAERVRLIKHFFSIQTSFQIGSTGCFLNKWRDELLFNSVSQPGVMEMLVGCLILYFSHRIGQGGADPGE